MFCKHYIFISMRSLYTNDIPGALPTIRYYEKSLIRARHEEEIARFGNKQNRIIDWYQPREKHVEPIDKDLFPINTSHFHPIKLEQTVTSLNSSKVLPVTGKVTQG